MIFRSIQLRFLTTVFASVLLLLVGCTWSSLAVQSWTEIPGGRWRSLAVPPGGRTGFTALEPVQLNVLFTNLLAEEQAATNRTLYNGSGVAAGDLDGDGLADVVFAGLQNQIELFQNLGAWRFTNITARSGISASNLVARGVVLADFTGDGALDVLVSATGGGVRAWRNDGRGQFTDVTAAAGTASTLGSMSLALADVDGNGTLDLYVGNNRAEDIRDRGQVDLRLSGGRMIVPAALTNRFVISGGQLLEYGEPDVLFLNEGGGRFHPVAWTNGTFLDETARPLPAPPLDWALGLSFRDLNDDGAPDLYVCNDFWTPDRVWINTGAGQFKAAPLLAFRQTSGSSMGVDMADLNGDGRPEIFVVDMLSRFPSWRKRQMDAQALVVNAPGEINNRPQSLRNTLFLSRDDGTYAEIAHYAGVTSSEWAWQPLFIDVDLDGQPDLLIPSGHAHDVQDRDAQIKVQAGQKNYGAIKNPRERQRVFTADLLAHNQLYPSLPSPIVAFRNLGNLRFEDTTHSWGTDQAGVHHGIATADFDGDGDLDLAINKLNAPALLYQNSSSRPRVAVRLIGRAPNTQAIGARVIFRGGAAPEQRQEVLAGGKYLSGSDPLLVFASGDGTKMTLEIQWRDGRRSMVDGIESNRLYEIDEVKIEKVRPSQEKTPEIRTWFDDGTRLLDHTHVEMPYDDFQRQPLLPRRLSQLGPGVSWIDLDQDGWEDLVIGSGAGGTLGIFKNDQRGGFNRWLDGPFKQMLPRDTTTLLSLPSSIPSQTALLAGLASYEDGMTNTASIFRFEPRAPGPAAAWRDLPGSIGPMALNDYDADGDLDLFAGARVLPGRWPASSGSILLRNENGALEPDAAAAPLWENGSPVSSAIWSDLEGDGFAELILAGEFAAPRIYRNRTGSFTPWDLEVRRGGMSPVQLSAVPGLWNSLSAGDFDGDGRMDLVLGNWGENSVYQASQDEPLVVFAGTFGTPFYSIMETVYDPVRKALTPSRPLEQLVQGFPFLAGRFSSHRAYSEMTVDEVLGSEKNNFYRFQASVLQSVILLNRGTYFDWLPLPPEAQFAPVFGIAVADFDLDGMLDLFLAQNFFATRPGLPRIDAGRGLLLKGRGDGTFEPVPGQISGLMIYGEQRGAAVADFDQDGRPDLAVTQNAAATRLFRNTCPRKGLRVRVEGPPGNPAGIGTVLRLRGTELAPAFEIRAGGGYWSQDGTTVVLPVPNEADGPLSVEAIFPGGEKGSMAVSKEVETLIIRIQ